MFPATDLDNHLVEVPARTGARTAAAKIDGDQSAEFQEPASYGLVRYINATFGQQVLDITKRQGEPSVKPDRVLDNLRRKPMSLEGYLDHPETVAAPDRFGHRLNVSMPSKLHRCLAQYTGIRVPFRPIPMKSQSAHDPGVLKTPPPARNRGRKPQLCTHHAPRPIAQGPGWRFQQPVAAAP